MTTKIMEDLEVLLATMTKLFAEEGNVVAVSVLALGSASIRQTDTHYYHDDQWPGYSITIAIPEHLYLQLLDNRDTIERSFYERVQKLGVAYDGSIDSVGITTRFAGDPKWREKAKTWLTGEGVTNQGRARSDNIAPRLCDGLLFRSQPEIHLYRAFKSLGVPFAPLPVFIRGGETYRRIEPDFIVIKDGITMHVEVDGDTVHHETPVDAHNRTTMLVHEGVHLERVNASDCDTPEKARACASRLLSVLTKIKSNA